MIIVVNFKNHKKGKQVLELAWLIQRYNKSAIVGVPFQNISDVSKKTKLKTYAQHLNNQFNAHKVKSLGANGVFLNHSDHRLKFNKLKQQVIEANSRGLSIIAFISTFSEAKQIINNKALNSKINYLAFEDPKLIGTGKSITQYKASDVLKFSKLFKSPKKSKILPLCGAGISSREDVIKAKKLGCKGVAIASAITKEKNKNKIKELLKIS